MPLTLSPTQVAFNARGDGTFNQPFQEQVDFLKQKLNLPTEHWDDILVSAHDRALIVAGAMKADLLTDFHDAINKVAQDGKSVGWFKKEFESIVKKNGWEGWTGEGTEAGRDWRARVIYNTNMRASYAAGRYAQLTDPELLQSRPYWKYVHNDTVAHPRPLHQSWNGTVLKYDDPWWQSHFCPNGFGCRCRITAVRADAYKGHPAPDDGTYEHKDRNGVVHTLPEGVDYGWDYAPGASVNQSFKGLIDDKLIRFPAPIGADMWQALKPALKAEQIKAVHDMVAVAAASMEPAGVSVVAHVVEPATIAALSGQGIELNDASIWLRDHELVHAIRDSKTGRGASLSLAVWLDLPKHLETAMPYLDTADTALLYAFTLPGEIGKVVVRINHLEKVRDNGVRKKINSNFIVTGGIIAEENLAGSRYVSLQGKKP
jgi:hypothetical protein